MRLPQPVRWTQSSLVMLIDKMVDGLPLTRPQIELLVAKDAAYPGYELDLA